MIRKFLTGAKTLLLSRPVVNGQVLFPNDATEIYFDMNNVRRKLQGVCYVQHDSDLSGISNPEEKLYFSMDSRMLFAYDTENEEFVQVNRTGVITNLTSSQRAALTSCAEDSIYIDSDTSIAYIGVNLGSNSESSSSSISVFWRRVGESISNYNGLVDIKTNNKNVISTNSNGDVEIGSQSNSVSINGSLSLNGHGENSPGGIVKINESGFIPKNLIFTEREDISVSSNELVSGKYTVTNAKIGDFVVLDSNGNKIEPDQQQLDNSVDIDFTGFSDNSFKIQFSVSSRIDNDYSKIALPSCSNLGFYIGETSITLSWTDPDDVELNESILAEWDKTVLVRKENSYPTSPSDGIVMATTSRSLINKNYYRDHSFIDDTVDSNKTYYYMLFSQTTAGTWNNLIANKFTSGTDLSWHQVGEFVEAGRGPELFPVGTTFIVEHPEYTTSTGIQGIAFTVLGHDQVPCSDETIQHTMCLGSEILFCSPFDCYELEYALTQDNVALVNKTYYTYNDSTYTALVEGADYQVGDDIPANTYYEKNSSARVTYGNANYEKSNLLQWANSDGGAGVWFTPQTLWDTCNYRALSNRNGFLRYLDKNFLSIVKNAKLTTVRPSFDGGEFYNINAKFWLLSISQISGNAVSGIMGNERLEYYKNGNSTIKQFNGINTAWWLRTPNTDITVKVVNNDGSFGYSAADRANYDGVSLACIVGKPNKAQYWKEVQDIVRKGKGPERFPVGTIFVVDHPEYTHQDGRGLIFRVVGHDQVPAADETLQHTMCLDMVDCLFAAPYDEVELEYALTEDTTAQESKTYYTLSGSTYTALAEGTDYDIGDSVPLASWYEKNLTGRSTYGSNNPKQSNYINWLNSSGSAGSSIQPMTIWDRCGATLLNKNGFLKHIDRQFLAVVQPAKLTTVFCDVEGGGSIQHTAKFWPLSRTQVHGLANNGIMENTQLDYYKNGGSKVKYLKDTSEARVWMLRSPDMVHYVYLVQASGTGSLNNPFEAHFCISPACIIG